MPPADTSILIVIPVWNDAPALQKTLDHLLRFWRPADIVVVDGGSADNSVQLARKRAIKTVTSARSGRALQMNLGVEGSSHEVFLFLHADTLLPGQAAVAISQAIRSGCIGGAFRRRFDAKSTFLRITCQLADQRGKHLGWFLGDQAIFVQREAFCALGGFPEQRIFEDLEFSIRMAKAGKTRLIKQPAISSARRFQPRGPVRQTLSDFSLTLRYLLQRDKKALTARNNQATATSSH